MKVSPNAKPVEISDTDMAFSADIRALLPNYGDIPSEFKRSQNEWVNWQVKWFFTGLKEWPEAKPGIDPELAKRHLCALQGSFTPKHEHKQAGVAYLASLWFKNPTV